MKKILAFALALVMVLGMAACGGKKESTAVPTEPQTTVPQTTEAPTAAPTEASTEAPTEPAAKGMTYAEFMAAELMEPVEIEAYVQGWQSYYAAKGTANVYLADEDGAYYCYGLAMTQEQFDKLEVGVKVFVSGEKAEYAGEIEISNGKLEEIDDTDHNETGHVDVAEFIGNTEELAKFMNQKAYFDDLVVLAQADGSAVNKKQSDSDPDLYFRAGNQYGIVDFCVESYLTGPDTEVYKAAEALKVGDNISVYGFLYWYNGANPHVTEISLYGNVNEKSGDCVTYAEYIATEKMEPVIIEAYVQGKQSYYAAKETANLYLADADGAYYCYGCVMTQEEFDNLEIGVKVRVSGEMGEYAGEIEVANGKLEAIMSGSYIAPPVNVTALIGDEEALAAKMNQKVIFKNLVVTELSKKESDSDPDIYVTAGNENGSVSFCVESYLTGPDSEAYKAADALKVGDVVDIWAFLYWYNHANPHVTAVAVKGNVNEKSEGVMTYAEYMKAELAEPVVIEAYIQGKQSYYAAKETANLYLADADGAYYAYGCVMTQEQFDQLEPGTKVKITGEKAEYAGEIEVGSGVLAEIQQGFSFKTAFTDVTELIGDEEALAAKMNRKVIFRNMTVSEISKKESDSDPDIYITAENENGSVSFCVESYLTAPDSEAYKAAEALQAGDVIDVCAFLYWYNHANPHIIEVVPAAE